MMWLYSLGVRLYTTAISLAAAFVPKARLWKQGRRNWRTRYAEALSRLPNGPRIWVHCASLGEFEQGRPVIEALRAETDAVVLLTFFSPSGYEIRKNYAYAHWVGYLPADTPANACQFVALAQPAAAIFVKYELWLHYLAELRRLAVPTYLISAYFRKGQAYFRAPYKKLYAEAFHGLWKIFVQNATTADLIREAYGNLPCIVAGDTRADRVLATTATHFEDPVVATFAATGPICVAGSTWPPDESLWAEALSMLDEQPLATKLRLIVAAHEVNPTRLAGIENRFAQLGPVVRLSQADEQSASRARILLVDSIGKLSLLYRYGTIAYVGGGFGKGIHNTLEPAAYGLPVAFGPKHQRSDEAQELLHKGAAKAVQTSQQLAQWLALLLTDRQVYTQTTTAATEIVRGRQGATVVIIRQLRQDIGL